jgi:hypothetical protein
MDAEMRLKSVSMCEAELGAIRFEHVEMQICGEAM